MKKHLLLAASIFFASPAAAQNLPTLDAAHQQQFLSAMMDISMPARSFQQIMQLWQGLAERQQHDKVRATGAPDAKENMKK